MIGRLVRGIRRNHALEHATIAMLMEGGVRPPLGGYSTPGGFFVLCRAPSDLLRQAANEALQRLREGHKELAVSPYCGTNLVAGALLSGLLAAVILGRGRQRFQRIPAAATAILLATLVSRPLGNALQRRYTTLADVEGMEIVGIRRVWAGPFTVHRVRTRV